MASFTIPRNKRPTRITDFVVAIPEDAIKELHQLLKLSKIAPETYEATRGPEVYGITREWLLETKAHWLEKYDWRKTEIYINSFPNYKLPIEHGGDTHNIHFAGLFSQKPDAVPIMFLHGWPGSFMEFLPIMDILRKRFTPETLPFHVVVPSHPGYAFSSAAPLNHEFHVGDVADIHHKVMNELGFGDGYIVQGGDIGSRIARIMSKKNTAVKGIHLNFCKMEEPASAKGQIYTDREQTGLQRLYDFGARGSAYSFEHATKPATLGFALSASPISLLAWVSEKFLLWVDQPLELDQILDSITLYWVTESIARSFYPYRTNWTADDIGGHGNAKWFLERTPFGYSNFPKELAPVPRSWVESTGNLVFYREHEHGGHFAAIEKPEQLLQDVDDFINQVWK